MLQHQTSKVIGPVLKDKIKTVGKMQIISTNDATHAQKYWKVFEAAFDYAVEEQEYNELERHIHDIKKIEDEGMAELRELVAEERAAKRKAFEERLYANKSEQLDAANAAVATMFPWKKRKTIAA